ncbi:MAG: hypothetical protein E6Q59_05155 [Nitrosomonas sp.]|nr:MAG: hypothetical protein E6Q59_05155 [Nitrosomonas sp.]
MEFYSGIRQSLKTQVLKRGNVLAAFGILLWLLSGAFIPLHILAYWGTPIFLLGGLLIAFGMVPYRRLTYLESHPHRIIIERKGELHFLHRGKPLFSVSLVAIEKLSYRDDPALYGIALSLKPNSNVAFHRSNVKASSYIAEVQRRHDCDLFLPYFGKNAFQEIAREIETQKQKA